VKRCVSAGGGGKGGRKDGGERRGEQRGWGRKEGEGSYGGGGKLTMRGDGPDGG